MLPCLGGPPPQAETGEFEVSNSETWATHRRIVGTVWHPDWTVVKVMFAENDQGDRRATQCRSGSDRGSYVQTGGGFSVATCVVVARPSLLARPARLYGFVVFVVRTPRAGITKCCTPTVTVRGANIVPTPGSATHQVRFTVVFAHGTSGGVDMRRWRGWGEARAAMGGFTRCDVRRCCYF